jgi:sigma-B regulation protein RsbU (phosphoserine phosphatase)
MAQMQATLRALISTHRDVGQILTLANRLLCRSIPEDHFVSLVFARLEPDKGRLVYSSAGHPTGLIFDSAGKLRQTMPSQGLPLGLDPEQEYHASTAIELKEGDLVVLYSDGLLHPPEPGADPLGIDGIDQAVRGARGGRCREIVEGLYERMLDHCRPHQPEDDVTVVAIGVPREAARERTSAAKSGLAGSLSEEADDRAEC